MRPSRNDEQADVEIVILEDLAPRREQERQALARGGFKRISAYPAHPAFLLQHLTERKARQADLVLFGLQSGLESSWDNLRRVHEVCPGPLLALADSDDERLAGRMEELGIADYLAWGEGRDEHLQLRVDSLLSAERIRSVVQENDQRVQKMFVNILLVMVRILDSKDYFTRLHSHCVAMWSRILGRACGLTEEQLLRLGLAGVLHDFGKIGIREEILNKPAKLTPEEFEEIKRHPLIARDMLCSIEMLADLMPAIAHHHERWDGAGYPEGLKGEQIPLWSRIIGLADAFDTMLSRRVYKEPYTHERIVSELTKGRGTQFDPHLVDILLEVYEKQAAKALENGGARLPAGTRPFT